MDTKKNLQYFLNLDWTYTIEIEKHEEKKYYIIRVNELPGICTDAETLDEGMQLIKEWIEGAVRLYLKNGEEVPVPIKKEDYKGNIAYRTTTERHYKVARIAKTMHKSISKTIDDLIDAGIEGSRIITN